MRLAALLLAVAAFGSIGLATAGSERARLTYTGLGDVRIGMSNAQAKALGFKLTTSGPWDEVGGDYFVSCHHLDNAPDYPDVALMMSQDRVVRIEIGYDAPPGFWRSYSGATNGMTEADIRKIYGSKMKREAHPYMDEAGSYLTLTSRGGRYAMIFETGRDDDKKSKRVQGFRSGLVLPVGYIEGCA
ncbi:MAG: hypothetical protein V3V15_01125 [Sphingorhabdus sp.]